MFGTEDHGYMADDHQLLRAGLKLLLQRYAELEVIGEAADGEEALAFAQQRQPDLLLLDLSMAKMNGLECMKEVKSRYPKTKIIILSMHEDETYIKEAMLSGAAAYVHKSAQQIPIYTKRSAPSAMVDSISRRKIPIFCFMH